MLLFSGKRIKTPERGLLSMHPLVDVLEGRSLFTGAAHDGVVDIEAVIEAPASPRGRSPWSVQTIEPKAVVDAPPTTDLAIRHAPGQIQVKPTATGSAFGDETVIGDSDQTLFANVIWDRRGRFDPVPMPTDEQIAAARAARDAAEVDVSSADFAQGRSLTGAMNPFLVMKAPQVAHLFAA